MCKRLSEKEQLFANAVVSGMSHKKAYIKAYKPKSTVKDASIHRLACQVFQRPHVTETIDKMMAKAEERAIATRTESLIVLSQIIRGKVSSFVDDEGRLIHGSISKSGAELKKVKVTERESVSESGSMTVTRETEVEVRDPRPAIERMAKMEDWDKQKGIQIDGVIFSLDTGVEDDE